MNGRQVSGLLASLLALSLMACTGSPLAIKGGPDGRPGGTEATPKIPSPSPFVELETPGQQDEAVLDEVPGLNWALKEDSSPRDQQIQRIYGALAQTGGYKFFIQQGEFFYYRTPAQSAQAAGWFENQKLFSHRQYNPTRLFSDGDWLFFVNDPNETQFSGEEKVYQAKEGSGAWAPSTVPKGVVAVAGGPGVAFAATERHLYRWNGQTMSWGELPIVDLNQSSVGERFIGLTVDVDSPSKDLIVLLSSTDGIPYRLKRLPAGTTGYANMVDTNVTFSLAGDRPMKVYRSFLNPALGDYHYWGHSSTDRIYQGAAHSSLKPYAAQPDFERPFKGFTKLMGRFYAYRNDPFVGPQIFHLLDQDVSSRWSSIASIKADDSALAVTLKGENSLATDGHRLYAAGPEGLFSHPLLSGAPEEYAPGHGGWAQETVELNRAPVNQVIRAGSALYAKTDFGTYTNRSGAWLPFELDGRPASIFTSLYGQAATVVNGGAVDFYLFVDGVWKKVTGKFPGNPQGDPSLFPKPKAGKVFFSKDRLFVAATVQNGEAIFQRDLKAENLHLDWIPAAPDQGLASTYPTYISDGRALLAVGIDKVRLASLSEQKWKDYPAIQVMPDGSTQPMFGATFEVPFAVYGYAFAWVHMGGTEYRLCRATAKGWKPIVSNVFNGASVGRLLSTDGHYLYSSTLVGDNTREIVRVPIKDGSAWEAVTATFNGVALGQAGLKVNAPPFIDRASAKVYLPTTRGILGP